jgi:ATP-binding cassette subfamily B multidrug efflux pump
MENITENKQISFYETITWLWKFWGKLKIAMVILIIMTPVTMWFRSYSPLFIADIFDELAKKSPDTVFIRHEINLFFLYSIIHLVFYIYIQSLRGVVNYRLENDFRLSLFKYIIRLGQNFFQKFSTGDLATRLIDDVSEKKLAWFACSGIFRFYEAVIKTIQCLFFMFMINSVLTWVTIIPLIMLVFIYIRASEKTTAYSLRTQQAISRLNSFLTTTIDGIRIVKSYNQETNQEKYFEEVVQNQREKEIELVKASSMIELSYTRISEIIIIMIFLVGGWLVINHKLTIGSLVAFNSYIFMLIWPMVDIGQFFIKGRGAGVSVQRISELENFETDIVNSPNPLSLPENNLALEFKNLTYIYPNGNKVLNDISFSVEQGQCVAIAGAVGSGKSTFINFLPRIIDPFSGEVLLNGINLKKYDLAGVRKKIGFVPQNPSLFSDSIRDNILFGRKNISEEALTRAIRVAQLEGEIESFPDKIDTMIGQRGVTLSGGQKQRVAIARAIVEKPEILILDDCTSALDAETESKLWNELYKFMPGITVFLITHRVSTLQKADKIVLLNDGRVIDTGRHFDLIEKSAYYRKIYD